MSYGTAPALQPGKLAVRSARHRCAPPRMRSGELCLAQTSAIVTKMLLSTPRWLGAHLCDGISGLQGGVGCEERKKRLMCGGAGGGIAVSSLAPPSQHCPLRRGLKSALTAPTSVPLQKPPPPAGGIPRRLAPDPQSGRADAGRSPAEPRNTQTVDAKASGGDLFQSFWQVMTFATQNQISPRISVTARSMPIRIRGGCCAQTPALTRLLRPHATSSRGRVSRARTSAASGQRPAATLTWRALRREEHRHSSCTARMPR